MAFQTMTMPELFLEEEFKLLEDDEHEDEDVSENNEKTNSTF